MLKKVLKNVIVVNIVFVCLYNNNLSSLNSILIGYITQSVDLYHDHQQLHAMWDRWLKNVTLIKRFSLFNVAN